MSKLRPMLPYLSVTAIGLYSLPLFSRGSGMALMLFVLPALILVCAVIYGIRNPFHWTYSVYAIIVSALFVPTIFIHYNTTAFLYTIIFGVIALVGIIVGRLFSMMTKL